MDNLLYLAILIVFSIVSSILNKKKKDREQENSAPDVSLEDEIRRMAERMMGKIEEEKPQAPVEYNQPEPEKKYKKLADEINGSPYDAYDDDVDYDEDLEPLEQIPTRPVVDYSQNDVEALKKYNETLKNLKYGQTPPTNYEQKSIDSLKAGHELHTVMNTEDIYKGIENEQETSFDMSDFDARKAIIYTEIFKRPEY